MLHPLAIFTLGTGELMLIAVPILVMIGLFLAARALIISAVACAVTRALREAREQAGAAPTREQKQCPDCAEAVLAAARVCKHCGYRFEARTAERA